MTLARREEALLALVERDRAAQCDAILAEARGRATALLDDARTDALARVREVFAEERHRAHETMAAARAKLQTRRRLHDQHRTAALLALAWQRLPDALRARWRDDAARHRWVDAILAAALQVLPRTQWRIVHGPDWAESERQALLTRAVPELDAESAFVSDSGIVAGLRIAAGGNVVDGTLAGLIDDRAEVGARLLRHLEQVP
jgi:vacuolar-type H+-ATPase subunit H